jgi:hypothetical protein
MSNSGDHVWMTPFVMDFFIYPNIFTPTMLTTNIFQNPRLLIRIACHILQTSMRSARLSGQVKKQIIVKVLLFVCINYGTYFTQGLPHVTHIFLK